MCAEDEIYNNNKASAHAYALLFDNSYSDVTKVSFGWAGGNNAFQVYLFGDSGSGYILLNSTNYSSSGASTAGSVEWAGDATDFTKFAIVARPGTTNTTATNKTLRAANFSIYKTTGGGGGDTPTTYTVTYNANGATSGSVPTDANEYDANDEVTVLGNTGTLAKTGNAFGGWNTQPDGSGTSYSAGGTFNITANTTLYAKWNPYTITAQSNNTSYGTVSLINDVITATPAEGCTYASPAYTVSSGSATVVQDGNHFVVTPSSDCTVTINFKAIPKHTVTFSVNNVPSFQDFAEGATITFPADPAAISGKSFVGWVTEAISGTTNTAPSFVTSATMGNSDITYYAVFADVTPGDATSTTKTITTSTTNIPTTYGSANTFTEYTFEGIKFKVQQMYLYNNKLQWRAAGNSNGTGTMYNTDALSNLQSVVLTYDGDDNKNFTLKIGDSENPTSGTSITPSVSQENENVYTYDCSSYNKSYFVLANGEKAGYLASIAITYIVGTPATYSNYCTTVVNLTASDLAITSSSPVALDITSANISPTSTITWTTSSTGTMNFVSDDESVATVSSAGVITAIGEGTAKITISQDADESYKTSSSFEVTVNVTDNRYLCATDIDLPTAQKTLTKGDLDDFAATSTKADGFTGSITYTYETSDESIVTVATGTYSAEGVGTANITITATPTGGNAANYKSASQEVAVTVYGTNSISLDPASKTVTFSEDPFDIAATVPTDNYNGTISAVSDNEEVAVVDVDGTTITVYSLAVGSVKITVTAGTGTYYPTTASAECNLTFTAPEGSATAPSPEVVLNETFAGCDGTGANDNNGWSGSIAAGDFVDGTSTDNKGWVVTNAKEASGCAKFGSGSVGGSATTPGLNLDEDVSYTLTFKAAAWDGTSEGTTLDLSATNANFYVFDKTSNDYLYTSETSVTLVKGAWTSYTLTVVADDVSKNAKITFSTTGGNKRFFLDDVKVTKSNPATATVTLNKYGYATYCSPNPIDFSSTTGYTAWRVSSVAADGTITFAQITEKVKGGQGVLLYNKDADGETATDVTINFADGTTEFSAAENKLVGTLAPTYAAADEYYGLSGNTFVKVNAGTVPAGKALLPASVVGSSSRLTFVFEDATGISTVESREFSLSNSVYTLDGRKVAEFDKQDSLQGQDSESGIRHSGLKKGLYIMNGKKVLVK